MKSTAKDYYARCSPFLEISVRRGDTYSEFAEKAAKALHLHYRGDIKLFKVKEGAIILNNPIDQGNTSLPWTIGNYCSSVAKRKPSLLKLGVGYLHEDSTCTVRK